jgi:guanylate kinase
MDINGANQVKKVKYPANYLAILPKSTDNIRERLRGRGTESEEKIENRINIGIKELEEINVSDIFDYKIVNDDFERAYTELKEKLRALYGKM